MLSNPHKKFLEYHMNKCSSYHWMYEYQERIYNRYNKISNISSIIITLISGALISIIDKVGNKTFVDVLSVINPIVLFLVSVINAVQQFLAYEKVAEKNKNASNKYKFIYNTIKCYVDLDMNSQDTDQIKEFCKFVNKEMESLLSSSPQIEQETIKLFESKFGKAELEEIISTEPYQENERQRYELNRFMAGTY